MVLGNTNFNEDYTGAALVVTSGGNIGIGTITSSGRLEVATPTTNPFLIDTNGNIGIGTTKTTTGAMSVMSGNVGIGTWVPGAGLDVETPGNTYFGGNVGIGSTAPPKWIYLLIVLLIPVRFLVGY